MAPMDSRSRPGVAAMWPNTLRGTSFRRGPARPAPPSCARSSELQHLGQIGRHRGRPIGLFRGAVLPAHSHRPQQTLVASLPHTCTETASLYQRPGSSSHRKSCLDHLPIRELRDHLFAKQVRWSQPPAGLSAGFRADAPLPPNRWASRARLWRRRRLHRGGWAVGWGCVSGGGIELIAQGGDHRISGRIFEVGDTGSEYIDEDNGRRENR